MTSNYIFFTSTLNLSTNTVYSISGCKYLLFGVIVLTFLFPMSILKYFPGIYKAHKINKNVLSYIFMFHDELIPKKG